MICTAPNQKINKTPSKENQTKHVEKATAQVTDGNVTPDYAATTPCLGVPADAAPGPGSGMRGVTVDRSGRIHFLYMACGPCCV